MPDTSSGAVPNQVEFRTTIPQTGYGVLDGVLLHAGGSPRGDEPAREDSWAKLLRFLAAL